MCDHGARAGTTRCDAGDAGARAVRGGEALRGGRSTDVSGAYEQDVQCQLLGSQGRESNEGTVTVGRSPSSVSASTGTGCERCRYVSLSFISGKCVARDEGHDDRGESAKLATVSVHASRCVRPVWVPAPHRVSAHTSGVTSPRRRLFAECADLVERGVRPDAAIGTLWGRRIDASWRCLCADVNDTANIDETHS